MSLTSTELNYLIWRYLQESGHDLAAFAFEKQTNCSSFEQNKTAQLLSKVEPGFLVNLVQKGILYSLTEEELRAEDKRSDILTFFGSLLKNEKDIQFINYNEVEPHHHQENGKMEIDEVSFITKILSPTLEYEDCFISKWNPINEMLAYVKNGTIILLTVDNNKISNTLTLKTPGMNNKITAVAWSPLGNIIITSSTIGDLCAWSLEGNLRNMTNGILKYDENSKLGYIIEITWSPTGEYFLTIDSNGRICLWESATLTFIQEMNSSIKDLSSGWSVCWLDNVKFALSFKPKSITINHITSGYSSHNVKTIADLQGHENISSNLVFDENAKYLASYCDLDGTIKLWTSSSISEPVELSLGKDKKITPLISINWINQGMNLFTVSIDGSLMLWDISSKKLTHKCNVFKTNSCYKFENNVSKTKGSLVYLSVLSSNENWLAIGDDIGDVSIWDISLDTPICRGIYNSDKDSGLCDLSWDKTSTLLSIAYNQSSSIIVKLD